MQPDKIKQTRGVVAMRRKYRFLFHVVLAVVVVLAQTPLPPGTETCESSEPAKGKSPEQRAARLKRLLDALAEVEKELPRDSFDVAAVADQVGRDPKKMFSWVRDNTFLVPYWGALRGSRGVLMDRQGNSLDRALLLGELLRQAQFKVKLVRGSLTVEQAEEKIANVRPYADAFIPAPESLKTLEAALLKQMPRSGLDATTLRRHSELASRESAAKAKRVKERVARQTKALARAVGLSGRGSGDSANPAVEAAREHWWVQYEDGGTWIDLDPTFPDAKPGDRLADVEATVAGKNDMKLEDMLDPSIQHLVVIRVMIEQWRDGKLSEQEVVGHKFVPFQVIDQTIQVQHVPENVPEEGGLIGQENPRKALQKFLAKQDEWMPVLIVGDFVVKGMTFDQSGDMVKEAPPAAPAPTGFGLGGLARALNKEVTNPIKTPGLLTAEWIEYQIHSPGRPDRTIRRQVFDLIGPAKRAGYQSRSAADNAATLPKPTINDRDRLQRNFDLAGVTRIVPQVCEVSPEFLNHLAIRGLLQGRQLLLALAKGKLNAQLASGDSNTLPTLPGGAYALVMARRQWRRHESLYLDRPNLLAFHQRFTVDSKNGALLSQAIDIVTNEGAIRPRGVGDGRLARLEQGVLDTIAEASLLRGARQAENTAVLYELSREQEIPWKTVHRQEDLESLELSRDVRARISQDLRNGYIAVAPTRPVRLSETPTVGWWRIDPKTGDTLGIGSDGWGQAASEYKTARIPSFLRMRGEGNFEYIVVTALISVVGILSFISWVSPSLGDELTGLGIGGGTGVTPEQRERWNWERDRLIVESIADAALVDFENLGEREQGEAELRRLVTEWTETAMKSNGIEPSEAREKQYFERALKRANDLLKEKEAGEEEE